VPAAAVVPGLDPVEHGGADVLEGAPRPPVELSIFIDPISDSHIALSSTPPTVPMLVTIPSAASRRVKAKEVYWLPWSKGVTTPTG
jgi:hypothetical protein